MTERVIIDCDPGHDDAIALLLALASPELELLGVSTVAGNSSLERTTANAIRVLEHVGRGDVPVLAGASRPLVREPQAAVEVHGESGLDGCGLPPPTGAPTPGHAVDWIAATLAAADAPVTLVALGPLTNVALLLARHPDAAQRIGRIVLMGGAIGEGNVTPAAEFNIWSDPEAAQRAFASGLELTMVGLDVTHRALLTRAHVERLSVAGRAGELVARLQVAYGGFHERSYGWDGAPVHDVVAVAHVLEPTVLETRRCGVRVEGGDGLSRGRTHVDRRGAMGWAANCSVAVGIDAERFFELLIGRLGALA